MMKRFFRLLKMYGLWCGLGLAIVTIGYAEEAPQAIRDAAVAGMPSWLHRIPMYALQQFNFVDAAEMDLATLGDPFRVYLLPPDAITNYSQETPVESLLQPTSIWYVPVLVNGEMRTLLTVELVEGQWQAAGIGLSRLATQWAAVQAARPPHDGYDHLLVTVLHLQTDYVFSTVNETAYLRPLLVAGNVSTPDEDETYKAVNVLLHLHDALLAQSTPTPK